MTLIHTIGILLLYVVLAPIMGGLVSGLDRILTARLQGRVGPSIFQSFFDVGKLFQKQTLSVRKSQNIYIYFFAAFVIFSGGLFFTGGDILLLIFALALANIFFVLGGFKSSSPYSHIGAERELIQMMSYEPMLLLTAVGMYLVTKSFYISQIASFAQPLIMYLPGVFIGLIYVITIKLRKSPFDLSTSHHAHQELVKGITTEFSGVALAWIEIAHWFELAIILGLVYLFFASHIILGLVVVIVTYLFEIFIDNIFARTRWNTMLFSSWLVSGLLGATNILVIYYLLYIK